MHECSNRGTPHLFRTLMLSLPPSLQPPTMPVAACGDAQQRIERPRKTSEMLPIVLGDAKLFSKLAFIAEH